MKRILAIVSVVLMLLSLAACGGSGADTSAQSGAASAPAADDPAPAAENAPAEETVSADSKEGERILRIGTIEGAQSYSPVDTGSLPLYLAYEFLCTADESGNITPWLAEEIEWIDESTLKIKLRDGIFFSNGEQMTGEDVLYSLYYAATAPGSMLGDKYAHADFDASYVEDDGLTVMVKMKDPFYELSTWLVKLCLTEKSATSERASNDPEWWDKPVSSSAYEIVENVDGSHVTFRLRDDYWDKEHMPQWDEITFYYYSNATAMFIAYENRELDLVLKADYKDYDRAVAGDIANADTTSYFTCSVNGPQQFILSPYCEYFEDAKVREAFTHALDTDAMGLVAFGTLYESGLQSYVSSMFTDAYEAQGLNVYDPELARQCMAESNYPDGFDITCIADESNATELEVVKENLAAIGVNLNVETYDFATMLSIVLTPGATDVGFFGGTLHSVDAYEAISAYYDGNAITTSRITDPEFNAMYYSVPQIADKDEQNEVLKQMQRWVYENMWLIPVCDVQYAILFDNTVLDCHLTNLAVDFVQYACEPVG